MESLVQLAANLWLLFCVFAAGAFLYVLRLSRPEAEQAAEPAGGIEDDSADDDVLAVMACPDEYPERCDQLRYRA